jgi:hypothetical protein
MLFCMSLILSELEGGTNQMSDKKPEVKAGRRDFLKLAGVATVSGGAALAAGGIDAEASVAQKETNGYRETDHVRAYYDSARF